jgi:amino acid adenylation domain-containing protein
MSVLLPKPGDGAPAGPDRGLHERFASQVARTPDAVAVCCRGEALTYRELGSRANQLAHHLRALGVGPEVRVGVCLEPSLHLLIALLGVLEAGGAYLPLDPDHPPERLAFLLDDSEAPLVLSVRRLAEALLPRGQGRVLLDDDADRIAGRPTTTVGSEASSDQLAYLMYTSGSTGRPKGVLVEHGNLTRLFDRTQPWFQFGAADVWTLFHSYGFDFSVWEMWGALLHGGRLVVVPPEAKRSPAAFLDLLQRERVTVLNQTPSAFRRLILAEGEAERWEPSLRLVIFGGESLDPGMLRPWFARHGDVHPQLVNMYGITETSVHATYHRLRATDEAGQSPIGRPIPDLEIVLMDETGKPVPKGVPGEIYVGGAGVARGYWRRPSLDGERFVPDPRARTPGARFYRSGDRAAERGDGSLVYLGRLDQQLKIHGYRIEPGEIEACLRECPGISEAAVVAPDYGPGDRRLVAYVTAQKDGAAADPEPLVRALRALAARKLPPHMRPASFALIPRMPLTVNGKIDRHELCEAALEPTAAADLPAEPDRALPRALAALWEEVLEVEGVQAEDDFFELGGDSLKAVLVFSLIEERFGARLDLGVLASGATVAKLAEAIAAEIAQPAGEVEA